MAKRLFQTSNGSIDILQFLKAKQTPELMGSASHQYPESLPTE